MLVFAVVCKNCVGWEADFYLIFYLTYKNKSYIVKLVFRLFFNWVLELDCGVSSASYFHTNNLFCTYKNNSDIVTILRKCVFCGSSLIFLYSGCNKTKGVTH